MSKSKHKIQKQMAKNVFSKKYEIFSRGNFFKIFNFNNSGVMYRTRPHRCFITLRSFLVFLQNCAKWPPCGTGRPVQTSDHKTNSTIVFSTIILPGKDILHYPIAIYSVNIKNLVQNVLFEIVRKNFKVHNFRKKLYHYIFHHAFYHDKPFLSSKEFILIVFQKMVQIWVLGPWLGGSRGIWSSKEPHHRFQHHRITHKRHLNQHNRSILIILKFSAC